MSKLNMRRFTAITLGIVTAGIFFSCSNDSIMERDSNNTGINSIDKANYRTASLVPVAMNSWMSGLQDNISISKISIPGTHDSGAMREIPSVLRYPGYHWD